MKNYKEWLKELKYLPPFMRDFHDEKDLFKTIHGFITIENNEMANQVSWPVGQCYVIDIFLWFMGMHGYTLQKSKADVNFLDIKETMKKQEEKRRKEEVGFLSAVIKDIQEKRGKE